MISSNAAVNHLERLSILLRLMEKFIRGKGSKEDVSEATRICETLFDWALDDTCVEGADVIELENRRELNAVAVKLHNKTRSLPPSDCLEIKALLKPVSALLLYRFHDHSVKAMSKIMKLLNRGGMELQHIADQEVNRSNKICSSRLRALRCFQLTDTVFKDINQDAIFNACSPIELQEMKANLFQSHMGCANLTLQGADSSLNSIARLAQVHHSISNAAEVLQSLPSDTKTQMFFCENLLKFGTDIATNMSINRRFEGVTDGGKEDNQHTAPLQEALYTLSVAKQTLDTMQLSANANKSGNRVGTSFDPSSERNPLLVEQSGLRKKVLLALCYVLMQLDRCDEALECIHVVEKESTSMLSVPSLKLGEDSQASLKQQANSLEQLLLYTKFSVFARAKRWHEAEACLRALLKETKSFETALSMVKTYVYGNKVSLDDSRGLFRSLLDKFPNEPHFTEVRLCNLQLLLSSSSSSSSSSLGPFLPPADESDHTVCLGESLGAYDAVTLSLTIIREHRSGLRTLTSHHYSRLKQIFLERVSWARIADRSQDVMEWSDCLLRLLKGTDDDFDDDNSAGVSDDVITTRLLKAEALLLLDKPQLALEECTRAFQLSPNTRTILMTFRCALVTKDASESVDNLLGMCAELKLKTNDEHGAGQNNAEKDDLDRIALAIGVVRDLSTQELSTQQASTALQILLKHWIKQYVAIRAWRHENRSDTTSTVLQLEKGSKAIDEDYMDTAVMDMEELRYFQVTSSLLQTMLNAVLLSTRSTSAPAPEPEPEPEPRPNPGPALEPEPELEKALSTQDPTASLTSEPAIMKRRRLLQRRCLTTEERDASNTISVTIDETLEQSKQEYTEMQIHNDHTDEITRDPSQSRVEGFESISTTGIQGNALSVPSLPLATSKPVAESESSPLETDQKYHLNCTLEEIKRGLLLCLQSSSKLIATVLSEGLSLDVLGNFKEAIWIADMAWNLGNLLLMPDKCSIKELRSPHSPTDLSSQMGLQSMSTTANNENAGPLNEPFAGMPSAENRLRTAAECLEIAEYLYHASSQLGQGKEMSYVIGRNRYMSLLLAACARLDADSLDESAEQARRQSIKMDLEECYAPYESKSAPETGVDDAANNKDEQDGGLSRLKAVEQVALNSLLKANDDVDKADELLQRNLGFEDDDSLMIRKTVLIVKFTLLCRVGTPLRDANETKGFDEIKSLHNSSSEPKKVGSKSALHEFVVNRERDFLQLSAEELKRCADIACSEPEGTTEVARKLLQLAWQAHNRHSNGTSNPSDNALESVPGKEDRSLMGNIFCQMIELSDSREDALGLSQEFYQLVRNDTISTSTCLPNTEGGRYSCPYTQESIDQVTAVAYNYGVTLAELNQKALAEQFINTAIGLMQYASEEIRQWSRRVEDTYLQVLSASAHTASQAKAYSTATLKEGIASVEEGASSEPLGESLEPGIVNLFDYKAAGLAPALEAVTGVTNNGDQGNSKAGNNDVTE